jgi:hypothetical protein
MTRTCLLIAALVLVAARPAAPTTVVPPSFDELVTRAEIIVVARVVAIQSVWIERRAGRSIVTDVTFSIERTIKGPVYVQRSLEFLGGTVGEDTLHVSGMPEFHVGDRDVLFVADSGAPVSPLVGFMYGRFRVVHDEARRADMIRTHDGRPLGSIADVGNRARAATIAPASTMTLDDFVGAVDSRIRALNLR